jgi:thiamine pyrophosphate-dependent acetolactate synthase large subunit-like protein
VSRPGRSEPRVAAPGSSATAPRHSVADAVGERLAALGVDTVFGLVGSGNLVVTNALRRGGARFVAARHEGGAIGMADGWARVSGRVGVCSVHQGPGLTNTVTGLAEAAKSRTPLLVLAGDTPAAALTSNFRIDQPGLAAAVGALAERIHSPASAEADAARALRRAELERRPVVLNLPIDLQAAPAEGPSAAVEPVPIPAAPGPRAADVATAAELLAWARAPVIIAGRGAVLSDAGPALERLADACGALVATTAVAHGLFATSPWALGIAGGFATPLAAELLPRADVVLAVGASLNHWTTRHGALLGEGAKLIQVDVEPRAIGANQHVALGVIGDAAQTANALAAALKEEAPEPPERARAARVSGPTPPSIGRAPTTGDRGLRTPELRERIAAGRWRDQPVEGGAEPGTIDPRALSLALADLLPAEKAVVVDSGHFTGWPAMYLEVQDPRAWLFVNGFQAVGLGLGCAVGAAVAEPGRVTVAAVGDGGLFLALAELESLGRVAARLLVVVYDDAAYGAEVHHFGPLHHELDTVRFPDVDLAALARAAGVPALTVREPADLAPVAAWLRDGEGPLLVDAKVDPTVRADWLADAFR